jgi:hypothetical protein
MAGLTADNEILHRIRVKLYQNYLPKVEGEYIARTDSERTLSIDEICDAMKTRGGYTGNVADLKEHIHLFKEEMGYQLCDGYAINMEYFSIHPNVGGTFDNKREGVSPDKHPVGFKFRVRNALRQLAEHIEVFVEGVAETGAFIDEFHDNISDTVNEKVTPGGIFSIIGGKIKIAGDPTETGIYFSASDGSSVKATGRLEENDRSKLIGVTPELPSDKEWTLEVRTQFSNSTTLLKEVRVIKSEFTLTT